MSELLKKRKVPASLVQSGDSRADKGSEGINAEGSRMLIDARKKRTLLAPFSRTGLLRCNI